MPLRKHAQGFSPAGCKRGIHMPVGQDFLKDATVRRIVIHNQDLQVSQLIIATEGPSVLRVLPSSSMTVK